MPYFWKSVKLCIEPKDAAPSLVSVRGHERRGERGGVGDREAELDKGCNQMLLGLELLERKFWGVCMLAMTRQT